MTTENVDEPVDSEGVVVVVVAAMAAG